MCEKKKTPHEVGLGGADNGTRTRGLNLDPFRVKEVR